MNSTKKIKIDHVLPIPTKGYLMTHARIHSREKPYQYSHCEKPFSSNSPLIKHLKTHTDDNLFQCSQCRKTFADASDFTEHVTREKLDKCTLCNKDLSQMKICEIEKHIMAHTSEKIYEYNQCDNFFPQNSYLSTHMKMRAGEVDQFIQCEKDPMETRPYQCNNVFEKTNCIIHQRIHTGEISCLCRKCEKGFSYLVSDLDKQNPSKWELKNKMKYDALSSHRYQNYKLGLFTYVFYGL